MYEEEGATTQSPSSLRSRGALSVRQATVRRSLAAATLAIGSVWAATGHPAPPAPRSQGIQPIDWETSPLDLNLRGLNGERFRFRCPPGKPGDGQVSGRGPYADGSSICAAGVHAGAIRARTGGIVVVEIRPGQASYRGSTRHFVHAESYADAWAGSFLVLRGEPKGEPLRRRDRLRVSPPAEGLALRRAT